MRSSTAISCPECSAAVEVGPEAKPRAIATCARCGLRIALVPFQATPALYGTASIAGTVDDREVTLVPTGPAEVPPSPTAGEQLLTEGKAERYRFHHTLGEGGMGCVFLCTDRDLRRQIALKQMLPDAVADATRRVRFVEEAQVTGQLEHPNIVPVYELGKDASGNVYYTMKWVRGRSLKRILGAIKEGSEEHSLGELMEIFVKVCDGVAFAHSRSVLHRDLKPDNVMVGDYGEVLVMDWGLAKILGRDDDRTRGLVSSDRLDRAEGLTTDGTTIGTPAYMPPEQASAELGLIDHRSDIYSLGAILYEILTLGPPIEASKPLAALAKVREGEIVPPEKRAPRRHVPRELSAIAMKCLARRREDRYQAVTALRRDVALFLEGRSVSAAPDTLFRGTWKLVKRNRAASAAIGVAALVLISVVYVAFHRVTAAMRRAVRGEADARAARDHQRATAIRASERFARQAVRAADLSRWDEAAQRVADAESVCPDGPWGPFARGVLARFKREHPKAVEAFAEAAKLDPANPDFQAALKEARGVLRNLAAARELIAGASPETGWQDLASLAEKMMAEECWREARAAFGGALKAIEKAKDLLPERRTQAEEWLRHSHGEAAAWVACEGFYDSIKNMAAEEQIKRVEAKLSEVNAQPVRVGDAEVKGGNWASASLGFQQLRYLAPLKGMPLTSLWLGFCPEVRDLAALRGMPLTFLGCECTGVSDLGPLRGMPLRVLWLRAAPVRDLGPLRGMPLTSLDCSCEGVTTLAPLKGMLLTSLACQDTRVDDLSPIEGMPLTSLRCANTPVHDLAPLRAMPLTTLDLSKTQVTDLAPLRGMRLTELHLAGCPKLTDLTPLDGMALERLSFTPSLITKGIEGVRQMKSLKHIGISRTECMPAEAFWKRYEAGAFRQPQEPPKGTR